MVYPCPAPLQPMITIAKYSKALRRGSTPRKPFLMSVKPTDSQTKRAIAHEAIKLFDSHRLLKALLCLLWDLLSLTGFGEGFEIRWRRWVLSSKLTPWFLLLCLPIRLLLKKWHRLLTLKIGSGQVSSWISDRWLADMPKRTQLKEDHRPQKRTIRQLECKLKFQLFRLSATSLTTGSRRAYSNPVIKADEISWMTSWLLTWRVLIQKAIHHWRKGSERDCPTYYQLWAFYSKRLWKRCTHLPLVLESNQISYGNKVSGWTEQAKTIKSYAGKRIGSGFKVKGRSCNCSPHVRE